jgi:CP family cyanate transporter-like MFS transporter
VLLVAANLRTAVAALSPIVSEIGDDIALDSLGIGLLGTLPPLCFSVFGLLAPLLRRRLGLESLLVVSIVAITAGHLLRGASGSFVVLALTSTLTFAGMGVANVTLPPIVKKYFPDRVGLVTSLYATVMTLFALLPPLVAVPVADSLGWRLSVAVWAVFGVLALVPWISLALRDRRRLADVAADDVATADAPAAVLGRAWHSPLAWALAALFGMTAMNVFAVFAWLPGIASDVAGVSPAEAGALVSLYAAVGVPVSLVVPVLATRMRSVAPLIWVGAASYVVGYAGLLLAPGAAIWLWVGIAGLGPLLFPLALVLINLRTRTSEGSIALSGFTQGVGYLIGALGPLLVGVLHEATGGWTGPLVLLLATVAPIVACGIVVARPHMLEDDWHRVARGRLAPCCPRRNPVTDTPDPADATAPERATPAQQVSYLKERVYVTFIGLAVLLAFSSHSSSAEALEVVAGLVVAALGAALAGLVAEVIAHLAVHGDLPSSRELRHLLAVSAGALATVVVPTIVLLLSLAGLVPVEIAIGVGVWVMAITLGLLGYLAVFRSRITWYKKIGAFGALVVVGLVVIAVQLLAHG